MDTGCSDAESSSSHGVSWSNLIHGISLVKLMEGQETCDLGTMIVQQGYKLSFIILYGHSRLDRPNEKICLVYVRF